jgi:predicted ATPase
VRVLATSREPLRIEGEVTWRTPSLALPDPETPPPLDELAEIASVRLFVQRATAASPSFGLADDNASAVSAICYRLDGIPLALELAAACVPTLSPQQIADRLGSALTLLRRGDRGTITRQQTLAATLAWSHDLLVDGERRLLRRLAVFAGSFSLEAVESVCGEQAEDGNVLVSLSRLVDTSMVVAEVLGDAARYRLLDTVRQFATEQLRASGEQAALSARHCDWYLQLAELTQPTSDGRRRTTATQLDIEIDNLRTALAWSLDREPETALRLCVALWRHWLTRGLFGEGRRWLEAALTACPDAGALRARALLALAVFDVRRGDPTRLNELGAAAIAVHRRPDELDGLAQVLHGDAVLGYMRGSWDEAWQRSVEAREAASSYGPERMMVSALHLQGLLLAGRGKLTEAAAALTEVRRDLGRKAEDVVVFPPLTLGFGLEGTPPGGPRVFFEETVLLGRLVADRQADGYVLCNLAEVARLAGDLDGAGALLEDAAARFATLDDCDGEGLALNLLGCVHRVRGSFRDARDVLNRSLQVRRDAGDRRAIGLTQANLGVLAAAQGDLHPGLALIEQAASGFEERQDRAAVAGLALTWVSVQADAGAYEAARNHLLVSLPTFRQIPGNQRAAAWGYAMLSDIEARLGARSEAAVALHEASARFLDLGAGDDEVRVRNTLEHLQSVE